MRRLSAALLCAAALASACASAPKPQPAPAPAPAPAAAAAKPQPAPAGDNTVGSAADEPFRAHAPAPGQKPELVLPRFEQAKLSNGLTVIVSTRKELPLVSMGVAFADGGAQDTRGKAGISDLAYAMLLEGAGGLDAIALDNAFSDLGASPSLNVGADGAFLSTRVLTRNLEPALQLLSRVTQQPTFAPKDFDRRKKQHLKGLVQRLGSPGFLAQQAYLAQIYGENHPYGHVSGGTPATVQSVSLADARNWYRSHTGPRAAALVFAGDITLADAQALAQKYFGGWKGGAVRPKPPPAPPVPPRQAVLYVPKPGLQQTLITVGRPGLQTGHPDEYALELASTVFGGFFGSRLNMNLREAKGYTYGANASSSARYGVGPLSASSAVRADVTGPALLEVMNELEGLQEHPITDKELESAREGLVAAFPGAFDSVEGLAGSAAALFQQDRPMDEFNRTVQGLQEASAAEVQRVAELYFKPELMQIVLVGDPQVISEAVEPMRLGKLQARPVPGLPSGGAAGAPQGTAGKSKP
ncbi:insulinase family protein [Aggregicoccus sp. 17bor-14]|uniref:M16 family metallopeptidase n=1 Tax=Myxococcaceae TaxID=31 RepID=UPI00129C340B|nr:MULTISPECIES: pitrilysin family protein [Myxococcaceae]MBF5045448.1 insulinase family protein [Simulacricoccus sp. 17bor-14]MRI91188.1 insulinase family protein [Aggregicoccus sp. 17bor-14]